MKANSKRPRIFTVGHHPRCVSRAFGTMFYACALIFGCSSLIAGSLSVMPEYAIGQFAGDFKISTFGTNSNAVTNAKVDQATEWWNSACGTSTPDFSRSGTCDIPVDVFLMQGADDGTCGACACITTTLSGGVVGFAQVTVFEQEANGTDCTSTLAELVAHEFGHLLGLEDSSCPTSIMGEALPGITPTSEECAATDFLWYTPEEIQTGDDSRPHGPCDV